MAPLVRQWRDRSWKVFGCSASSVANAQTVFGHRSSITLPCVFSPTRVTRHFANSKYTINSLIILSQALLLRASDMQLEQYLISRIILFSVFWTYSLHFFNFHSGFEFLRCTTTFLNQWSLRITVSKSAASTCAVGLPSSAFVYKYLQLEYRADNFNWTTFADDISSGRDQRSVWLDSSLDFVVSDIWILTMRLRTFSNQMQSTIINRSQAGSSPFSVR